LIAQAKIIAVEMVIVTDQIHVNVLVDGQEKIAQNVSF
jgi:hypothetical protein